MSRRESWERGERAGGRPAAGRGRPGEGPRWVGDTPRYGPPVDGRSPGRGGRPPDRGRRDLDRMDRGRAGRDRGLVGSRLTARDRQIVDQVDGALRRGFDLDRWWHGRLRAGDFERRFDLAFTFNRPDTSYGFFDTARVGGRRLRLLGNFQEQFYDQPKSGVDERSGAAEEIDRQLRQFVLRYFLRVADFRDPQPYTGDQPDVPRVLQPVSLCFPNEPTRLGFGYSQAYFKRADTGEIGKFREAERSAIVDLRTLGPVFDWIVLRVRIFSFAFVYEPLGSMAPSFKLPLEESSYLVLHRRFILDERRPHAGELGHYGFGYSFLRNPDAALVAWGPGKFDAAFQTIDFHVLDDGRIRVTMMFVANRPDAIAAIPFNPLLAGALALDTATGGATRGLTEPIRSLAQAMPGGRLSFDPVLPALAALGLATGGLASSRLCIDRDQVDRQLILTHFVQHYNAIQGSLQTWRQIADWLDESALPRWVLTGESA